MDGYRGRVQGERLKKESLKKRVKGRGLKRKVRVIEGN